MIPRPPRSTLTTRFRRSRTRCFARTAAGLAPALGGSCRPRPAPAAAGQSARTAAGRPDRAAEPPDRAARRHTGPTLAGQTLAVRTLAVRTLAVRTQAG